MCEQKWGEGGQKDGGGESGELDNKGDGSQRNGRKLCNITQCFTTEKAQGSTATEGVGTRSERYGNREVQTPLFPFPRTQMAYAIRLCAASTKVIICKALFYPFTSLNFCCNASVRPHGTQECRKGHFFSQVVT